MSGRENVNQTKLAKTLALERSNSSNSEGNSGPRSSSKKVSRNSSTSRTSNAQKIKTGVLARIMRRNSSNGSSSNNYVNIRGNQGSNIKTRK